MPLVRSRVLRWAVPIALVILLLILGRTLWLRALGWGLIDAQEPFRAEMVVVLAGDDKGNRIAKAAELVRQGYAPKVLVSGPECCYGLRESDLAIAFAVRRGYPSDWFVAFPVCGGSTRDEAREILGELERRGVGRFMVVTSNYHTGRTARVFRGLTATGRFRVVAAPDWVFRPEDWWRSREGRKQVLLEWTKTFADWAGL